MKERVVRGGVWLALGVATIRGTNLLKLIILGRLLAPNDFGLMGIAMVVLKWLEYFTETGFNAALIQKPGNIRPYLDTAWTVQIFRSAGLTVILFVGAPLGASFFDSPEATAVIRAVGLITLLQGFTNPAVVCFRKELDFRRQMIWKLSGALPGQLVAVALALAYRNAWALVLAVIASQAAETLVSYRIEPYRPRLRLEWTKARELVRFGKWVFWLNVLNFLGLYIDSIFVGKMLGTTALGFYQMAYQLAVRPTALIGTHVHGIMFPTFSKLQEGGDLGRAFLRTLALVSSVVVPVGCFLTLFADPLVRVVLGERWASISPALRILTWAGVATAVMGITSPLLQAAGKPELPARAMSLQVLILAGLLYPLATSLGITGAALAVTASTLVAMAHQLFLAVRLVQPTSLEMVEAFKGGALGSTPFLAAGLLVSSSVSPSPVLVGGLAIGVYLMILLAATRSHISMLLGVSSSRQP